MTRSLVKDMPQRENRLTFIREVAARVYPSGERRRRWLMRCSCGNTTEVDASQAKRGVVKSCGCLHRDVVTERTTKHGLSHRPEYLVWANMVRRCTDQRDKSFCRYGAIGVRVCDEWRKDFAAFFSHIGPRPTPQHSIDRIDNERGYEPGNVRWATATEQNRNKRSIHKIPYNGRILCLTEYCNETGLNRHTVSYRISVLKQPIEKAIGLGDQRKRKASK